MAANSRHLKRHSMPTAWPIKRKNISYIARPKPGSHSREYVASVVVLLRDVLGYAQTSKDAKYVVKNEEVLINGKKVTDIKAACGMFDIFEIKKTNEKFTLIFDEFGKIKLIPTKDDLIYLRVSRKTITRGKKYQLNLMNGYNLLVSEKDFKAISVNDTVVYDFAKKKVSATVNLKEGTVCYIFDGKFKGQFGTIKKFTSYNGISRDVAEVSVGKETQTTAKDYLYAIGSKMEDSKRFS